MQFTMKDIIENKKAAYKKKAIESCNNEELAALLVTEDGKGKQAKLEILNALLYRSNS